MFPPFLWLAVLQPVLNILRELLTFFSFNVYPLDLILKSGTFIFPALIKYQTSTDAVCNHG